MLIVVVWHGSGAFTRAGVEGDVALLRLTAAEHRANREALRTWRAEIEVVSTRKVGEAPQRRLRSSVEYVYSAPDDAVRWDWTILEPPEAASTQSQRLTSGLRTRAIGATYHLDHVPAEGQPRYVSLVEAGPPRSRRGLNQSEFDPAVFFNREPEDLESRLEFVAAQETNDGYTGTWVRREGQRIILSVGPPRGYFNRYEFDLEKGGNLVRYLAADDDDAQRERGETIYTWERIAGVWLPKQIARSHSDPKSGTTATDVVTWLRSSVNEPLSSDEFTPERAGVRHGDIVADARSGAKYRVGGDSTALAIPIWGILEGAVLLVALIAAVLVVRRVRRLPE